MINVFDYCINNKIPFIFASSSAIYGDLNIGDDNDLNKTDQKEIRKLYPQKISEAEPKNIGGNS